MVGILVALLGLAVVVLGRGIRRSRVRDMFGVCDEWSLALCSQTAVVPRWMGALFPAGLMIIAMGLAAAVAL